MRRGVLDTIRPTSTVSSMGTQHRAWMENRKQNFGVSVNQWKVGDKGLDIQDVSCGLGGPLSAFEVVDQNTEILGFQNSGKLITNLADIVLKAISQRLGYECMVESYIKESIHGDNPGQHVAAMNLAMNPPLQDQGKDRRSVETIASEYLHSFINLDGRDHEELSPMYDTTPPSWKVRYMPESDSFSSATTY